MATARMTRDDFLEDRKEKHFPTLSTI